MLRLCWYSQTSVTQNTDGWFTMANLNSFFESLQNSLNSARSKYLILFYHNIVCCVYSLELPH